MKKLLLPIVIFAATLSSCDDKAITFAELPQAAQNTVASSFGGAHPISTTSEGLFSKDYEVKLDNGAELEFNSDGEWTRVDCHKEAVPSALVPSTIASDVATRYAGGTITEIKKEDSKTKVEVALKQGAEVDLEYSESGEFLRIDDKPPPLIIKRTNNNNKINL